jgi:hypothetical protein
MARVIVIFCNTWEDFLKRFQYPRKQAIVYAGNHTCMPAQGQRLLYARRAIHQSLQTRMHDFGRFEDALFDEFGDVCDVYPARGHQAEIWQATCDGAIMQVRAWMLGLRPVVSEQQLAQGLRSCTTATEFARRVKKFPHVVLDANNDVASDAQPIENQSR